MDGMQGNGARESPVFAVANAKHTPAANSIRQWRHYRTR